VLDIGAHVGHYTAKLSGIVGKDGRVIALEPVPTTFELLVSNSSHFPFPNVTLLNVAASDQPRISGMGVPRFGRWLDYYMAYLSTHESDLKVLCTTVDNLGIPHTVSLVKIDAEGHDYSVLLGMKELLERDHPILIIEERSANIFDFLEDFGYPKEEVLDADSLIFCSAGKQGTLSEIARRD
jgi:FkbM family methyltransferase